MSITKLSVYTFQSYLDRVIDITFNPFWKDVCRGLNYPWKAVSIIISKSISFTLLWYIIKLQLPMKKDWVKGI